MAGGARPKQTVSMHTVWVDAQLPPALARWFRTEHGINAVHLEELGLHRARDRDIFEAARTAAGPVVVITKDGCSFRS